MSREATTTGKLRIGNDWNAISIIALGQSNPLKAVAELVENSIDAGAEHVTIVRGKEKGDPYLTILDDGRGIRKNAEGLPDFRYVATHICDSFKRKLKSEGVTGIQGEFGIGLLSFWTLGEVLYMTSASDAGHNYEMQMARDDPSYHIRRLRTLVPCPGTELKIKPLLPGLRGFSGEKLEWYLASELRDRIRRSKIDIRVIDRQARKEFHVVPRQFDGELLHQLPPLPTAHGEIYLELYLTDSGSGAVGLYRSGTRVLEDFGPLESLAGSVWGSGHIEGIVDVPFLTLTPGTRSGLIRDDRFLAFELALTPVTEHLDRVVEEHRLAQEEQASAQLLKRLQRAFREAILALPIEEYDWFDIHKQSRAKKVEPGGDEGGAGDTETGGTSEGAELAENPRRREQRDFFDYPGPLHSVRIAPTSSVVAVGQTHNLQALCRDRAKRTVTEGLEFQWEIVEGLAVLDNPVSGTVLMTATSVPGLVRLQVTVRQGDVECRGEAAVTVTDQLLESGGARRDVPAQGLPGYTFEHAPAALWRVRLDTERNLIVINNGHRDFVYANRNTSLKLRYIARLYAKELVQKNFPGASAADLLERLIELTLYMEENLR